MGDFLDGIRRPGRRLPLPRAMLYSTLIFVAGIGMGILSKVLDLTPSNELPAFLEALDLRNFFSRIGVWIFLSVSISVYSRSPLRAALHVFGFLAGMVGSYYLYTVLVAGFYPKSYMMIWIGMTMLSPILAVVCWYAKGRGFIALLISSIVFMVMFRQAFSIGFWYWDITYPLELLLLLATVIILYQSPKQIMLVIALGVLLALLIWRIDWLWGLL